MPRRSFAAPHRLDLRATLGPLSTRRGDPTHRLAPDEAWRATRTPHGPAALHLRLRSGRVEAEAWGPGADWALDGAPALVGMDDAPEELRTEHDLVRRLQHRHPGLRLCRSRAVTEILVPTILAQKVTGLEARRAWHRLVRLHGEPAPGDSGLRVPPSAATLAALPYYDFHRLGVERRRADTVRRVCAWAVRVEEVVDMPLPDAYRRLMAFPGVGIWTAANVARVALGDPDAVEVGDYHVPNTVAWNLAGEARADDARMLELLEPFRGQRGRVVRLLEIGAPRAPSFGPRQPIRRVELL